MKVSKVFTQPSYQNKQGYSGFPMDNLLNMTSLPGYLYPVYWDILDPGDKVSCETLLRTQMQPLTSPAMCTMCERIEWFAVPIQQLYKPFSAKYYGINDVESDLLPTTFSSDGLPFMDLTNVNQYLGGLVTSLSLQQAYTPGAPTLGEATRLLECLGVSRFVGDTTIPSTSTFNTSVGAIPFAAYQKIYYDHYRLTDYEVNDPEAYNLDSFYNNPSISTSARLNKLLQLRKRPYQLDYFTSAHPSPLFGSQSVNATGVDLGVVQQWLTGLSGLNTAIPYTNTSFPSGGSVQASNSLPTTVKVPSSTVSNASSNSWLAGFNPANIRSLFAVEKLLEVTRRAKKHYDMQTLAHFGVDVPKGLSGECFKLGTHEQYIRVGEILSTADTATASLGVKVGNGHSSGQSKKIYFEAKCHCVLMAIYSVEPIMNYINEGTDRLLTSLTSCSSLFKPEFDDLGEQPAFKFELFQEVTVQGGTSTNNSVLGWQKRYQQNKAKKNRSITGCSSTFFQEWALNRHSFSANTFNLAFFQVWPTDINNILLQPYSGIEGASDMYSMDCFINQFYFDVIKSSKKSVFGVPNL